MMKFIKQLARRCRKFQIAADRLWPAKTKSNRPTRVEFKLPPDKSLS